MKFVKQFGIILLITFIGEVLHALLPIPVPAGIYGIVLLFLGLKTRLIPVSEVKEASSFLIQIMPIMFIPAAVGLIDTWDILAPSWIQFGGYGSYDDICNGGFRTGDPGGYPRA